MFPVQQTTYYRIGKPRIILLSMVEARSVNCEEHNNIDVFRFFFDQQAESGTNSLRATTVVAFLPFFVTVSMFFTVVTAS